MKETGMVVGFKDGVLGLRIAEDDILAVIPPEIGWECWDVVIRIDPYFWDCDYACIVYENENEYYLELANSETGDVEDHDCKLTPKSLCVIKDRIENVNKTNSHTVGKK